jgi:hypothetical protein
LENSNSDDQDKKAGITFGQLLLSTLSAFIGVQSNANRERDFTHGKVSHFIAIGVLLGLTFVLSIVGVVSLVIKYHT